MEDDKEPRDPFREEAGGPWHYSLRQGEMLFQALAELPDITSVIIAMKDMPESELQCVVAERLYIWHATKPGGILGVDIWLSPPEEPDS